MMVTAAFEGTASEGVPDIARNCRFELTGGEVDSVSVFYFGDDSLWEGTRHGFGLRRAQRQRGIGL